MSAIQVFLLYINHSEFRGPLLGASVNGELTVHVTVYSKKHSACFIIIFIAFWFIYHKVQ